MQNESFYQKINQLINSRRLNEAESLLDQIILNESQSHLAHFQLGYIRQVQGQLEEAEELFLRSLSICPGFKPARQYLTKLEAQVLTIKNFRPEPDAHYVYWYNQVPNWGDVLNVALVEKMSGKKVIWAAPFDYRVPVKYLVIGSTLKNIDTNTIVWGTGALSAEHIPAVKPKKICAVRGQLTRQLLIGRGIDCPEIYGDPALLYPRFYNPEVVKKYAIGIVPHYVDRQQPWLEYAKSKGAKIIDIQGELNQVVDDIKSCARVASSSLHGIIAADAYGIPSSWVEFSDGVIGNGYKFRDYYQSINRPPPEPVRIKTETSIDQLDTGFNIHGIDIDLDLLFNSCPFLDGDIAGSTAR